MLFSLVAQVQADGLRIPLAGQKKPGRGSGKVHSWFTLGISRLYQLFPLVHVLVVDLPPLYLHPSKKSYLDLIHYQTPRGAQCHDSKVHLEHCKAAS